MPLSLRVQLSLNYLLLQNKSPEFVQLYQSVHPVPNATAKVGERGSALTGSTSIARQGLLPVALLALQALPLLLS